MRLLKNFIRIITLPIVYLLILIKAIFKWFIIVPIAYILFFIKNAIIGIIIGAIVGIFLTPIATAIIWVLTMIATFSSTWEDVSDNVLDNININWSYSDTMFSKMEEEKLIRKEVKLIKIANKKYNKNIDEFEGFNKIADIYAK
jgi:hypothetical protein